MSAPGQTIGVSVFTDYLLEAHGLSRNALSLAYCLGTAGSALLITRAGVLYDRYGGRWVTTLASLALAAILVELSFSPAICGFVHPWLPAAWNNWVTFVIMTISFFALRFCGQGVLTLASRNMVMEWFEKRRGMATAVVGISVAFGFSATPQFFDWLIGPGHWQWAWRVVAGILVLFGAFTFLFARARPEDHGLKPDGPLATSARPSHAETRQGRSFTLYEAQRTYSFWVFTFSSLMSGLLLTAFSFHLTSIFADVGIARRYAVSIFLPVACISVVFEFLGSWISDYVKLKYLAMIQLSGISVMGFSLGWLAPGWPVWLLILGMGMMQGMFGIVSGITWPRFYGRDNLGAISGFSTSVVVFGTAVGPWIFSYVRDWTGSYASTSIACGVLGVMGLIAATRADRPE